MATNNRIIEDEQARKNAGEVHRRPATAIHGDRH